MQLNYFQYDHQALKEALRCATNTVNTQMANNGKQINGYDQKGNKLFVINHIDNIMGWQIGFYVNNLSTNN
jgi:hypothetical protein